MQNELIYPMSLDYVKTWGMWESFRELVSNAKDAGEYKVTLRQGKLTITDNGAGLVLRQLLLGVSEKSDTTTAIGQFGEGLKLALLVLTRLNKHVVIYSGDKKLWNETAIFEKTPILKICYDDSPPITGTKIVIDDWGNEDYRDRFLEYDDKRIIQSTSYGQLLNENKLYVKGVYCQDLPEHAYGYNFADVQMNRDRNTADNWNVRCNMGYLWGQIDYVNLWEKFFVAVNNGKAESDIVPYNFTENASGAMAYGFRHVYGEKAVIALDDDSKREASHKGAKAISSEKFGRNLLSFLSSIVGTAEEYLDKRNKKENKIIPISKLSNSQKQNLALVKKIARKMDFNVDNIVVKDVEDAGGQLEDGRIIVICPNSLMTAESAISTFIHEMAHFLYSTKDMTEEHVKACSDVGAKITMILLKL